MAYIEVILDRVLYCPACGHALDKHDCPKCENRVEIVPPWEVEESRRKPSDKHSSFD